MSEDIIRAIDAVRAIQAKDECIEKILRKYLEIDDEKNENNLAYKGWAIGALQVGVTVANLLMAIKQPDSGRNFRAISDLSYILNVNEFWSRNSSFLMPLIIITLNSHKDYLSLASEPKEKREYAAFDRVLRGCEMVGLDIFSALLYLVGGPDLMGRSSASLKLELSPYLVN